VGLRLVFLLLSAIITVAEISVASSQGFPNKPIRIVTTASGGSADFVARVIAQGLSGTFSQQVIVDNRGSGVIPAQIVSKAQPDGYTLLVSNGTIWITPLLQTVAYDVAADFSPISLTSREANILVVTPSLPVGSVKELIALLKANPKQFNYASAATGTANHLAAELFKAMAGVDIVRIAYKGTAAGINDVISGQVHLMFPVAGSVAPHLRSGRVKGLAVTSAQPSALFPALPTLAASGLPDFEAVTVNVMFAPAKTSLVLVALLNQEVVRVLNRTDVREKFSKGGIEIVGSSPEQLAATMKLDMARMGKVIKDAGIHAE
jgi:tripartite-type tricarboxylate transporter receptor subunit TctC